jgi:hypothetical protein
MNSKRSFIWKPNLVRVGVLGLYFLYGGFEEASKSLSRKSFPSLLLSSPFPYSAVSMISGR